MESSHVFFSPFTSKSWRLSKWLLQQDDLPKTPMILPENWASAQKKSTLGSDFRPNSTRNLLFCDVITHYKSNYQLMLMPFPSLHIARGRIWQPQGGERNVSCSAGTACMWDEFRAPDSNLIQTQPEPKPEPNQNLTRTQPKPNLNPTLLAVPAWKYQRGRSREKTRPYPANWKINLKNLWDKERC